jgi:hypothetical protein
MGFAANLAGHIYASGAVLFWNHILGEIRPIIAGAETVRFRTRSSAQLRVHVITAPQTSIAGVEFCVPDK